MNAEQNRNDGVTPQILLYKAAFGSPWAVIEGKRKTESLQYQENGETPKKFV